MLQFKILIIDDEKNIRDGLATFLEMQNYAVEVAENGKEGIAIFNQDSIDLVITDLRMPVMDGDEVLKHITATSPGVPVIVLTGHGSIDGAVDAMKRGAYDFISKPLNLDRLQVVIKRALQGRELILKNKMLQEELVQKTAFNNIIGKSPEMVKLYDTIRKIADSKASVLITGESGVGKELIANAIHQLSSRKDNAFIKVHCAALTESLLESELFGHEKGAFTGAVGLKRGRFELAHNGTIFLDEIGEINQNVQIKILRILQEKQFERVGGEETLNVDVRVITATNRDLQKEIAEGRFREDLFYRLNVVNLHIPPLRERKEDLPLLITSFLNEFNKENNKKIINIDNLAKNVLYSYDWPGNIRQLRNCIESAVLMCTGDTITINDLPPTIHTKNDSNVIKVPAKTSLAEVEKIVIAQNLLLLDGNKSKTAEVLQIGRKTLHRKIEEYGLNTKNSD